MKPLALIASISRIHIVAIGAMGTLTFAVALCRTTPLSTAALSLAALSASDWFIVNLLNRVVDLKEDAANAITGTDFVAKHKRPILAVGFLALALSFVITVFVAPGVLPFRAAFHALGFAYNWPLLPGQRRIKQLAFWKNTASATGFLLTVFGYPLATLQWRADVGWSTVWAAAAFFFLFELSYEVLYDLRDVEGDELADVRTWPVLFGVDKGWRIAQGLMIAAFVVDAVLYEESALPSRVAVMGAAPLIQLAFTFYVRRRDRISMVHGRGPKSITTADCIGITWLGVFLLAGYHVWNALGLPGSSPP